MKKLKVRHLTEEDYNNYVMALKDERPVKCIVSKDDELLNKDKNKNN